MNRDKKRVRGGAGDGGGWDGADYSEHALHWSQQQQQGQPGPQGQQGSHEQQVGGEGGRGAQQTAGQAGAGDSWVWQVDPRNHCDLNKFDNFVIPDKFITVAVNISNILLSNNIPSTDQADCAAHKIGWTCENLWQRWKIWCEATNQ